MLFVPRVLLIPYVLPLLLFAGGGVVFKLAAPGCGQIAGDARMFVLTGDPRRIPFAVRMLRDHPHRRLYVIGAGTPAMDSAFAAQIEIESRSKSTYENAIAVKSIARRDSLGSIAVITTADHMNRALFLIRRQLPYVEISVCSVPLDKMPASRRLERWTTEYIKFLGTLLGLEKRG
jgi:uncharacterized SAM-binding protein YcdF (DUF218 family)